MKLLFMNKISREKNKNYTVISNVFVRDNNLSLKAKGFLSVVMSLPEKWDFSVNGICAITKEGKNAVYNVISELIKSGYCTKEEMRNENNEFSGIEYTFYEEPISGDDTQSAENQPRHNNPHTANPNAGNPCSGNETQISKDNNKEQIETTKDKEKENNIPLFSSKKDEKPFIPPTIDEVQQYIEERGYHVSARAFIDYYEADDWHYGQGRARKKVSNWKRCLATWESRYAGTDDDESSQSDYTQDNLFMKCVKEYERVEDERKAYCHWRKLSDDEKILARQHIISYVFANEKQYRCAFERYLKDKMFNRIVTKGKNEIFDPNIKNELNYYPQQGYGVYWSSIDNCFYYVNSSTRVIDDGYYDEERPHGAKLVLNNARGTIMWNSDMMKWVEERLFDVPF